MKMDMVRALAKSLPCPLGIGAWECLQLSFRPYHGSTQRNSDDRNVINVGEATARTQTTLHQDRLPQIPSRPARRTRGCLNPDRRAAPQQATKLIAMLCLISHAPYRTCRISHEQCPSCACRYLG